MKAVERIQSYFIIILLHACTTWAISHTQHNSGTHPIHQDLTAIRLKGSLEPLEGQSQTIHVENVLQLQGTPSLPGPPAGKTLLKDKNIVSDGKSISRRVSTKSRKMIRVTKKTQIKKNYRRIQQKLDSVSQPGMTVTKLGHRLSRVTDQSKKQFKKFKLPHLPGITLPFSYTRKETEKEKIAGGQLHFTTGSIGFKKRSEEGGKSKSRFELFNAKGGSFFISRKKGPSSSSNGNEKEKKMLQMGVAKEMSLGRSGLVRLRFSAKIQYSRKSLIGGGKKGERFFQKVRGDGSSFVRGVKGKIRLGKLPFKVSLKGSVSANLFGNYSTPFEKLRQARQDVKSAGKIFRKIGKWSGKLGQQFQRFGSHVQKWGKGFQKIGRGFQKIGRGMNKFSDFSTKTGDKFKNVADKMKGAESQMKGKLSRFKEGFQKTSHLRGKMNNVFKKVTNFKKTLGKFTKQTATKMFSKLKHGAKFTGRVLGKSKAGIKKMVQKIFRKSPWKLTRGGKIGKVVSRMAGKAASAAAKMAKAVKVLVKIIRALLSLLG